MQFYLTKAIVKSILQELNASNQSRIGCFGFYVSAFLPCIYFWVIEQFEAGRDYFRRSWSHHYNHSECSHRLKSKRGQLHASSLVLGKLYCVHGPVGDFEWILQAGYDTSVSNCEKYWTIFKEQKDCFSSLGKILTEILSK